MFKKYKFGCWKKEIRQLLRKRTSILARIRYHKNKVIYHEEKIKEINEGEFEKVEKDLNYYLKKAGN